MPNMVFANTVNLQKMTHCTRPVDPPPEDLMPEYITIEDLGKILEGGSEGQPTVQKECIQQNYVNCSTQSKESIMEIDLTENENIKKEFPSVCEAAQSPRSSCSESELQIDISEHDVHIPTQERDLNQLTSQSYKAEFQCETCPYETDIRSNFEVHLKVHRTVFACEWCHYITKSKVKLKNHQLKNHKSLVSHLIIHCSYCSYTSSSERSMKKHLQEVHQKSLKKNKKKSDVETTPEVDQPIVNKINRPESPYSEPRLQIDLGYPDEHPSSTQSDSEAQIDHVCESKPQNVHIELRLQIEDSKMQNNTKQQISNLTEPSTNNLLPNLADIKVECTEQLIQTCNVTQLTSQSRKAQFQCDICPYESDFQEQFEVHLKVHKTVYACSLCKYRTSSEIKLTRHQSLKCRNTLQKLEVDSSTSPPCTFTPSALVVLKNQFQVSSNLIDPKFCCKICRKKLDNQTTVDEHMWKHTFFRLSKNSNKLKCPKCNFMDRAAHVMRGHYSAIHRGCPHYDTRDVEELPQDKPKSVKKKVLKCVKEEPKN